MRHAGAHDALSANEATLYGVYLDRGTRRDVVQWVREVGDPWTIKGRADRRPRNGSDLASDDAGQSETSRVAHHGIIMALDHLGSVVDAMICDKPMRHYAHLTTLRTVLMSSVRVRWLLEPNSSNERQLRGVQIRHVNLDEQRKAFNTLSSKPSSKELEQQRQEIVSTFLNEMTALEAQATVLGAAKLNPPPDILSMLQNMVAVDTADGFAVLQLWRMGSAAAHGYFWLDTQRPNPHLFDEDGFDMALYGATRFVAEAMYLYEQRAGLDSAASS